LPACAPWRLAGVLFKSRRNGRGLAYVYYGRGRRGAGRLPARGANPHVADSVADIVVGIP